MKKNDAKNAIKKIWIEQGKPSSDHPYIVDFYQSIEKNHPELLNFKVHNVDKFQIIKAFVFDFEQQ